MVEKILERPRLRVTDSQKWTIHVVTSENVRMMEP